MNNKIWHLTFPGDLTWRSSLGNNQGGLDRVEDQVIEEATDRAMELTALQQERDDLNYQVAQEHFSLDALNNI